MSNFHFQLVFQIFHVEIFLQRKIQIIYTRALHESEIIEEHGRLMEEHGPLHLMMLGDFQTPVQHIMTHVRTCCEYH